ncbi:SDR family oxidoreductase [uncultured Pseudokineococcus sp.]|uniref:SDR family oxidoreductase n=1 Tax=uncultured Pseudokineococcus sp. TaxID=1642928 RepID=UPI002627487F|nr:3-beta hydroxysteroid dehydrogenase [uncultured Pseudokineococcus sp.]
MRVAVVGGTGRVGRPLVEVLRRGGHDAVVVARSTGADVVTGRGLDGALAGCGAVVDVSGPSWLSARSPRDLERFFAAGTDRVGAAARRGGVEHHVVLSAVGVDRLTGPPLLAGKRAQEERARRGPVRTTVVRATPAHEAGADLAALTRTGDSALVPPVLLQPLAVQDLAVELARVAVGPPRGLLEVAGPRPEDLVDMARRTLAARREPLDLRASWRGTPFGPEAAGEVLLPGPRALLLPTTFDSWLLDVWVPA